MKKIIDYLEQLGLSEIETRLYLALLKTGATGVRELAASTGLKRTTAYLHIDLLIEKGLVMKVVKGSRTQVAANHPDHLKYLIEKKLESAMNLTDQFPEILHSINTTFPKIKDISDAEIKYYKGKNGVKKIYEEALNAKELHTYVNLSEMEEALPQNLTAFADAFKHNPSLKIFEILEDSPTSREQTKLYTKNKGYSYKFLPHDVKIASTDILIYDGRVGIINLKDKITGTVLYNIEYYNISKDLFNFIWKVLPKTES